MIFAVLATACSYAVVSTITSTSPKTVLTEHNEAAAKAVRAFTQTKEFHLWMTCSLAEFALTNPTLEMTIGAERLKDILEQISETSAGQITPKRRVLSHGSPGELLRPKPPTTPK